VPPKMYYDHQNYAAATVPAPTTLVRVGTTPGGGEVYAPSTAKTPAPPTIQVRGGGASRTYTIVPKQ
jgi:hypothetical protein